MTAHANPLHQLRERGRDNVTVYAVLVIGAALWLFPLISTVRNPCSSADSTTTSLS